VQAASRPPRVTQRGKREEREPKKTERRRKEYPNNQRPILSTGCRSQIQDLPDWEERSNTTKGKGLGRVRRSAAWGELERGTGLRLEMTYLMPLGLREFRTHLRQRDSCSKRKIEGERRGGNKKRPGSAEEQYGARLKKKSGKSKYLRENPPPPP